MNMCHLALAPTKNANEQLLIVDYRLLSFTEELLSGNILCVAVILLTDIINLSSVT